MRNLANILVTGGAGFIGSNFIRYVFKNTDFTGKIVNVDKLTYAGNPENLQDIDREFGNRQYFFEKADIGDRPVMEALFAKHGIDTVVHFAAESHVDRSIHGPEEFVRTNILGTFTLLDVARNAWKGKDGCHFHHVSTDEVYGSLGETGYFHETTPYDPRSPYSASKAGSDHLVMAYHHTYDMSITLSNCSNNYGPYQFPEKLIPVMIQNIRDGKPLPVYGDGRNIRDWLYVDDHNSGVWAIVTRGRNGETYNIGGENEWENIKLVHVLCELMAEKSGQSDRECYKSLITHVTDRPGHDRRYAINCDRIKSELGWKQAYTFTEGLAATVDWYLANTEWVEHVKSGEYRDWIEMNYTGR
ncbi:MAG: dTDP-glucose 4,6-dehydratase [Spirochaetota bacterium]